MDKYYYLVSELPSLSFDQEPPLSREDFLEECRKWLSSGDFKVLTKAIIEVKAKENTAVGVLNQHRKFYNALKNQIKQYRQAKKEGKDYKISYPFNSSLLEGDPLEVEKKLLKIQWDLLEDSQKEHYFDLSYLVLYYLKLQLQEALFTFDKEKGLAMFDEFSEVKL